MKNSLVAQLLRLVATLIIICTACAAATQQTIYTFPPNGANGSNPMGGLIADSAGNLYGTTKTGGAYNFGTVYELLNDGSWTQKVLYNFAGYKNHDGEYPGAALVIDANANLYGTTLQGGKGGGIAHGSGTAFMLSRNIGYRETIIHYFGGQAIFPTGIVMDTSGTLYVTVSQWKMGCCGSILRFFLNKAGAWAGSVLHNFGAYSGDGAGPTPGMVLDNSGNLYGTTIGGGANGYGTVFKLTRFTKKKKVTFTESVIYSFSYAGGANPEAAPVFDSSGNLYGTTVGGGDSNNDGVVYQLVPGNGTWTENVLHVFGSPGDGNQTSAGLIFDNAGNLYGTTPQGPSSDGVVFELSPTQDGPWTETILYTSPQGTGGTLNAPLLWDAPQASFFSTTAAGHSGAGTVYEITP